MIERDMEDLIAKYPDDFFPGRGFRLKGRQQSFADVGIFDLLFEDHRDTNILMELKAVTAKYAVADQLARYKDELDARGEKHILMWLVAPLIPSSIREFLDRIGIEYNEIHFGEFRRVAERNGFSIRSETTEAESAAEKRGDAAVLTTPKQSRDREGILIPTGPVVTAGSVLRWKAYGHDLAMQNCKEFDGGQFLRLVDAFQDAVPSKRNASLIEELKRFGANPCSSHWPQGPNASLLRWVTTSSYKVSAIIGKRSFLKVGRGRATSSRRRRNHPSDHP